MYKDCVYSIFIMTTKCLRYPDTTDTCVVNWLSNITGEIIHRSLNNVTSFILGCKVGTQDKSLAPHICCVSWVRVLTRWVNGSPKAVRRSHVLDGNKTTHPIFISAKITGIVHTVKYLILSSAIRLVPHIAVLHVSRSPGMTFSDDSSDYDEAHRQEGEYFNYDPIFGAGFTQSEPNLLTKEDLNYTRFLF